MTGVDFTGQEWRWKGATLSDKTARSEYGLTQDEIIAAIRSRNGKRNSGPRSASKTRVHDRSLGGIAVGELRSMSFCPNDE